MNFFTPFYGMLVLANKLIRDNIISYNNNYYNTIYVITDYSFVLSKISSPTLLLKQHKY